MVMADRIAIMESGRLVQIGPPREIYRRPKTRFVAGFLGAVNFVEGRVVGRAGDRVELRSDALGVVIEAESDAPPAIGAAADPRDQARGAPDPRTRRNRSGELRGAGR